MVAGRVTDPPKDVTTPPLTGLAGEVSAAMENPGRWLALAAAEQLAHRAAAEGIDTR